MKLIRVLMVLATSVIVCGVFYSQATKAASSRNWIDSILYHREIPRPNDAGGCINEQWVVVGDNRMDFHGTSTLPISVCAYHSDGFSYGIYERNYTSYGLNNWMYESKLAVKKNGDSSARPVNNTNFSGPRLLAYMGQSTKMLMVDATPGYFTQSSAIILDDFLQKLTIDPLSGYYNISFSDSRPLVRDAMGNGQSINGYGVSSNGKWIAAIANGQLVRLNMENNQKDIVANRNFVESYMWPDPIHNLFISNDGLTLGYLGRTTSGVVFKVSDECMGTTESPLSYLDRKIYTNCPYKEIGVDLDNYSLPIGINSGGIRWYLSASMLNNDKILQYKDSHEIWHQLSIENFTGEKYLALGDSYASGEGDVDAYFSGNYLAGTDIMGDYSRGIPREMCHQSINAYPFLLGAQAGLQRYFGMNSVACSGAVKINIAKRTEDTTKYSEYVGGRYLGQLTESNSGYKPRLQGVATSTELQKAAMDNLLPGRVQQIEQMKQQQPYVATIQISGNDLGFGPILTSCILNWAGKVGELVGVKQQDCDWSQPEFRAKTATAILNNRVDLVKLYRQLKEASPKTQLYAVGYPLFIKQTAICWNTASLSPAEQEFIVRAIQFMNQTVRSAASEANIRYIDIEDALGDQTVCGKSGAMTDPFDLVTSAVMADMKKGMSVDTVKQKYDITNSMEQALIAALYRNIEGAYDSAKFAAHPMLTLAATTQQLFHPNAEGHRLIADKIKSALGDSSILDATCDGRVIICPSTDTAIVPEAPQYFGRQLTETGTIVDMSTLIFENAVGANSLQGLAGNGMVVARRDSDLIVKLSPSIQLSAVPPTLYLHSDEYKLGVLSKVSDGMYEATIKMPHDVPIGMHIIEAQAQTSDGQPYFALMSLAVVGDDSDEDGDGIADKNDLCLYSTTCKAIDTRPQEGVSRNQNRTSDSTHGSTGVNLISSMKSQYDEKSPLVHIRTAISDNMGVDDGEGIEAISANAQQASKEQRSSHDFTSWSWLFIPIIVLAIAGLYAYYCKNE